MQLPASPHRSCFLAARSQLKLQSRFDVDTFLSGESGMAHSDILLSQVFTLLSCTSTEAATHRHAQN